MASFEVALTKQLDDHELALPKDLNKARFVQNCIALTETNDDLRKWVESHNDGAKQVLKGAMRAAYLGLDFMNKECYLIPYGSQLQFMTDYKGVKKLCRKYSKRPIKEIFAKVVRQGDDFQESIVDGNPHIDFKPLPFNNNEVIGAFAVCLFADGGMIYETMTKDELEKVRSKSKMGKGGAWAQFTNEMYKKVVLRRLCKGIELDFDNPEQIESFNADTDINNSIEDQVASDIAENANSEEFVVNAEVVG